MTACAYYVIVIMECRNVCGFGHTMIIITE